MLMKQELISIFTVSMQEHHADRKFLQKSAVASSNVQILLLEYVRVSGLLRFNTMELQTAFYLSIGLSIAF